ncbi:TPA: hypothetical protein U1D09_000265 [Streptococcus suis]|nr:hypothetical protein [Streptococcus suis]
MRTFCIMNKRTGKFIYGTDYRYSPPHQRTSDSQALTYSSKLKATLELEERGCGREYVVVQVSLEVVSDI